MAKKKRDDAEDTGRDELGRFAKGNQYATANRMYETPEQLQAVAEEYLETMAKQKNGVYKPTLTGLVFHLGFESLQSFYDYEKKAPFTYTVKRLRLFVQSCYEQNLYGFSWAGAFAALRNIGREDWKEEQTQHQNQTVTQVTPQVINTGVPLASEEKEVKE